MGEVYLADDLTLGEPVTLEFLTERRARNEAALARFRDKERRAWEVPPNVVRVHDIGFAGGGVVDHGPGDRIHQTGPSDGARREDRALADRSLVRTARRRPPTPRSRRRGFSGGRRNGPRACRMIEA